MAGYKFTWADLDSPASLSYQELKSSNLCSLLQKKK